MIIKGAVKSLHSLNCRIFAGLFENDEESYWSGVNIVLVIFPCQADVRLSLVPVHCQDITRDIKLKCRQVTSFTPPALMFTDKITDNDNVSLCVSPVLIVSLEFFVGTTDLFGYEDLLSSNDDN